MLTIWIIPFPVMVFSDFPVLVNEKSNLQIRIGYFAFLPSLDISGNPTKKQGKPKLNPTWIFDFFSSGGKFFDLYMCRHPRALKSLAKITDTKPVFSANAISLASRQMFVTTLGGREGILFFSRPRSSEFLSQLGLKC